MWFGRSRLFRTHSKQGYLGLQVAIPRVWVSWAGHETKTFLKTITHTPEEASCLLDKPPWTNMPNKDPPYGDEGYFGSIFREARHNPCLMTPLSLFLFLFFGIFFIVTLVFQCPTLLLGLLLSPILQRTPWYIEFLYPMGIAKWGHFFLMSHASKKSDRKDDKNRGFHSRTAEQKYEVVPGRVYIHPIPQFVDNLGYLVVCLPGPKNPKNTKKEAPKDQHEGTIVAALIDCGDASAVTRALDLIEKFHYSKNKIQIHAICSTHKHHDHTGGNHDLMKDQERGNNITHVFGGAVEKVPACSHPVANGDVLDLPKVKDNNMNHLIEIEVVAVPGHTRGSVVYRLRSKVSPTSVEYLFTGDTMFSAGGGVPFEADIGNETEKTLSKSNGNTFIRAGIGQSAMERSFAEILSRALPNDKGDEQVGERILVFPGHEYTSELLSRQFHMSMAESCKWKNFAPMEFFETVSQMYIALHRRSLPHNSGRLLAVPSTIRRELAISPHFRSMKRTAELVVRAIIFWHTHFCEHKINDAHRPQKRDEKAIPRGEGRDSNSFRWNLGADDVNREIFTTVYTADLESIVDELASGKIKKNKAIKQLRDLKLKMKEPVINRRPIPNALPSDKHIYQGVAGLALLGSPPSAMTFSDSRTMNLAPPIDSNSDRIRVSMKRLIIVLERLGVLNNEEAAAEGMIRQLWKEAGVYMHGEDPKYYGDSTDVETDSSDEIELGILKWVLYGIPANQPSWFAKNCCMPCSKVPPPRKFPDHPAKSMKQKHGNLVAHDVYTCALCRNATGCALADDDTDRKPQLSLKESVSDESLDENGLEMDELANQLLRRAPHSP